MEGILSYSSNIGHIENISNKNNRTQLSLNYLSYNKFYLIKATFMEQGAKFFSPCHAK
jgi:hypothetical protein